VIERQHDVLRLQPQMISAVRSAFADALSRLNNTLVGLRREGNLVAPWLGDETSRDVAAYYSSRAMDGPQSSYDALVAYRDELGRIHDTLQQMEADYRRDEAQKAADLRRMT
jgi:hypothetical protein